MNIRKITEALASQKHPSFAPGDTVAVHIKIKEGEKERVQVFEGIVMKKKGGGNSANFTVRKVSFGIGVERVFPNQCANIEKVEVVKRGRVRRAKLFYIRELQGKALRIDDSIRQNVEDESETTEETSGSETKTSKKSKKEVVEAATVS